MFKSKFVHIFSGGLDSTVLLYDLLNQGHKVTCIHFQYGSKHNKAELDCAKKTCEITGTPFFVFDLESLFSYFHSTLLKRGGPIPKGYYTDSTMQSTVVPFRNGILLSIAAGFAESIDYEAISYGAHSGDHAIYPDCRPVFVKAISQAIMEGTYKKIRLTAPYLHMSKSAIVTRGSELKVPFQMTWTCYNGNAKAGHCGKCGSCSERIEAFHDAGCIDTVKYVIPQLFLKKEVK